MDGPLMTAAGLTRGRFELLLELFVFSLEGLPILLSFFLLLSVFFAFSILCALYFGTISLGFLNFCFLTHPFYSLLDSPDHLHKEWL
jgi:hypothetical protein